MEVKRIPIHIPHNRRNEFNPEFLDKEFLLEKFTPLIQSLHRYFCSYAGILDQPADVADLYSQIQLEFLKLIQKYDPKRGVDFPGYVQFNLRHRVYYYVTRLQNRKNRELLLHRQEHSDNPVDIDDIGGESIWDKPDESVSQDIFRMEAIASIPWKDIPEESDRQLIRDILIEHKTLHEIALSRRVLVKVVQQQFNKLCEFLIDRYRKSEEGKSNYEKYKISSYKTSKIMEGNEK